MKICLDAGHYGKYNQSPADRRYFESDMTWKLHLLQKKYLEQYGIQVITTRSAQEDDRGLFDRGAASAGCDLFISDHSNAVGSGVDDQVDYPAAYCAIDGSADGIGMALAQCVEQVMGTAQKARIEHRRGSRGDYYGVLRGATAVGTPGLILEHSFHTNTAIAAWLLDENHLERLARAQAAAIALYYNLSAPEEEKKSGWYQEEGKPAQEILPGTVIHIPANVKHWHGAAKDSWFAHLAFEIPGENTSNEWLEPVSDEEYGKLKKQ